MTPFDLLGSGIDIITRDTYSAYNAKTDKEKQENKILLSRGSTCYSEESSILSEEKHKEMTDLSKKIRDLSCSCQAWGSCKKDVCPCEKLCPDNFDIFKRENHKKLSDKTNSFSFRNFGPFGYCWGHASLTQQFNRLAFFDKNKKLPKELIVNESDSDETKYAKNEKLSEYYEDLIDKVTDNEVVSIPGYSSLKEFSEDYSGALRETVRDEWAGNAMSFSGAGVAAHFWSEDGDDRKDFAKDVKSRLDNNMQPLIVFTAKNSPGLTHALLVDSHKEDKDGNITLCLRDNNYKNNSNCENKMKINVKTGKTTYGPWSSEIGGAVIGHNNDPDAIAQVKALREKCMGDMKCEEEFRWFSKNEFK